MVAGRLRWGSLCFVMLVTALCRPTLSAPAAPAGGAHGGGGGGGEPAAVAVGKAFYEAINRSDAATAKKLAIGNETQLAGIDAVLALDQAGKKLRATAVSKFGAAAAVIWPATHDPARLAKAPVEMNGDTAVIAPEDGKPVALRIVDGKWKIDLAEMPGGRDPQMIEHVHEAIDVVTQTAGEIERGSLKDLNEARTSLGVRMMAVMSAVRAAEATARAKAGGSSAAGGTTATSRPFGTTAAPTTAPAGTVLDATDTARITAASGKPVIVEGVVQRAAWSKSGKVMTVQFAGAGAGGFQAAVFAKHKAELDAAFGGDVAAGLSGKRIRVQGTVQMFHDHPEIAVDRAAQITVIGDK